MKAELKSRGTMYRKELVSKTGTGLSSPITVTDRGPKPRCILLYRTVARNGCGIPLSFVCPKISSIIKMLKNISKTPINRGEDTCITGPGLTSGCSIFSDFMHGDAIIHECWVCDSSTAWTQLHVELLYLLPSFIFHGRTGM